MWNSVEVGYNVGGIPECVDYVRKNGFLATPFSCRSTLGIIWVHKKLKSDINYLRDNAEEKKALNHYSYVAQAKGYMEIMNSIC